MGVIDILSVAHLYADEANVNYHDVDKLMHYVDIAQQFFIAHDLDVTSTPIGHLAVILMKAYDHERLVPYEDPDN